MLRRLLSKTADALSTNHPILWAARLDLALLLAVALSAACLLLVWLSTLAAEADTTVITPGMRTAPTILMTGISISAVLFWFSAVQKAAYRDIAPSHQRHPSILELFIGAVIIAVPGLALVSVISNFGLSPTVTPSDAIQFYVNWAIGPSVVFAPYLFLALRLPLRTVTYLLALSTFLVFVIASFMLVVKEQASAALDDEQRAAVANHIAGAAALVMLAVAIIASRKGHATPRRLRLIALTIALAPAIALFIHGTIVSDVVQFMMKPRGIINPFASGYGQNLSYLAIGLWSLLLAEWLAARWTRVNLAPK